MSYRTRHLWEKTAIIVTGLASVFTALVLVYIIGTIAITALPSLNLDFIIKSEFDKRGFAMAIGNAFIGTIYLSTLAVALATPLSLGTAIYMRKYAKDNKLTQILRLVIEILSGTPSIVFGVVGLVLLSYYLHSITGGWSLTSGALALSVLIFPFIERTIEEAISTVPTELEHASYAMGATKWKTVTRIVIPYCIGGIATGVVLGVGRAAEESAVVLLTTGYSQFYPVFSISQNSKLMFNTMISPFQEPIGTLPIAIYNSFTFPSQVPVSNGMAAALVLIAVVFSINISARLILWRWKMG